MAHFKRGYTRYSPSNFSSDMNMKCDQQTATNNGTIFQATPPLNNWWPGHRSDLRAVYGKDSGGATDSCIAMSAAGTLYALSSTFQDFEGNTYTTYGLRSERYRVRNFK